MCFLVGSTDIFCGDIVTGSNEGLPHVRGKPGRDVIFELNLAEDSGIRLSTCGGVDWDSSITLYDINFNQRGQNDNSFLCVNDTALASVLTKEFLPAGDYIIVLEGMTLADFGNYSMSLICPRKSTKLFCRGKIM